MSNEYHLSTVYGGQLVSDAGGTLELSADKPMTVAGTVQATDYGAAFGPLEISAYPESAARVGGLNFDTTPGLLDGLFGSGSGEGLFAALPFLWHRRADENAVTRRDILKAGAAGGLLVGGASASAVAAGSTAERTRAQFVALENPAGIRLRVFDRVPHVMPPESLYYTYANGQDYESFTAANESDYGDVLPTVTGTITVGPSGSGGGFLAALSADKTQTYEGLALPKPTSDADTGEKLTISNNDIIVEHVQTAGASDTTLAINGDSIPHVQESSTSPRGYYAVEDGALIYRTGSSAPSGQSATLVLYADASDELLDDLDRQVS